MIQEVGRCGRASKRLPAGVSRELGSFRLVQPEELPAGFAVARRLTQKGRLKLVVAPHHSSCVHKSIRMKEIEVLRWVWAMWLHVRAEVRANIQAKECG